jgi:hypothetical protein
MDMNPLFKMQKRLQQDLLSSHLFPLPLLLPVGVKQ